MSRPGAFQLRRGPALPTPDDVFREVVSGGHETLGDAVAQLAPKAVSRDRSALIKATIRAFAARFADQDLAAHLAKIASVGSDETVVTAAGKLVAARLHDRARLERTTIGDHVARKRNEDRK